MSAYPVENVGSVAKVYLHQQLFYYGSHTGAGRSKEGFAQTVMAKRAAEVPFWGLVRVSRRSGVGLIGRSFRRSFWASYKFTSTGIGVNIYVVDSGVDGTHPEFSGRVRHMANFVAGEDHRDLNGHGTAVASIAAGDIAGVAKAATIWSVKVLDAKRKSDVKTILKALQLILVKGKRPAVVNLSVRSSTNRDIAAAVRKLVEAGFVVVVGAGNDGVDSCSVTPSDTSRVPHTPRTRIVQDGVISVAAASLNSYIWPHTNYGECVSMYAPTDVLAAVPTNLSRLETHRVALCQPPHCAKATTMRPYRLASGTSMSTPFVAGAAAKLLEENPHLAPHEVKGILLSQASKQKLKAQTQRGGLSRRKYSWKLRRPFLASMYVGSGSLTKRKDYRLVQSTARHYKHLRDIVLAPVLYTLKWTRQAKLLRIYQRLLRSRSIRRPKARWLEPPRGDTRCVPEPAVHGAQAPLKLGFRRLIQPRALGVALRGELAEAARRMRSGSGDAAVWQGKFLPRCKKYLVRSPCLPHHVGSRDHLLLKLRSNNEHWNLLLDRLQATCSQFRQPCLPREHMKDLKRRRALLDAVPELRQAPDCLGLPFTDGATSTQRDAPCFPHMAAAEFKQLGINRKFIVPDMFLVQAASRQVLDASEPDDTSSHTGPVVLTLIRRCPNSRFLSACLPKALNVSAAERLSAFLTTTLSSTAMKRQAVSRFVSRAAVLATQRQCFAGQVACVPLDMREGWAHVATVLYHQLAKVDKAKLMHLTDCINRPIKLRPLPQTFLRPSPSPAGRKKPFFAEG